MTIQFDPTVRRVNDQHRENAADREYTLYDLSMQGIEAELNMIIPRIPRDEFEDMRDLLAARRGVLT